MRLLASGRIFGVDLTSAQNLNFHGFSRKSSSCDLRYFRFILICLGKSYSEENVAYMRTLRFPFLDFLVSSVQFSVNNKSIIDYPINCGLPVDATLKTRQCKTLAVNVSQSRFACACVLGTFSQTTCCPIIFALRLDSWTGQPQMHRPKIVNRWFILILRKEVIQPHLPIRLPCYDFTPVTFPTLDGFAGFGCE